MMKKHNVHTTYSLKIRILSLLIASVFMVTALPTHVLARDGLLTELFHECAGDTCDDLSHSFDPQMLEGFNFDPSHECTGNECDDDHNVFEDLFEDERLQASGPASKASSPELQGDDEELYGAPEGVVTEAERIEEDSVTYDPDAVRERELLAERSETAKVYKLSDGYREAQVSSGPVHFLGENNNYIDIVTDLVPSASEDDTFGTVKPLSIKDDCTFTSLGDGGSATLVADNWSLSMTYAKSDTTIPLAVANVALYSDVDDGIDLEYKSMWWGIKETIVLTKPTEQNAFDFRLTFEGLEVARDLATSRYQLIDTSTGRAVLDVGDLVVTDATFDWGLGEYISCEDVWWELTESGDGWATLRANVDSEWIAHEDRVWPVRIDPPIIKINQVYNPNYSWADSTVRSVGLWNNYPYLFEHRVGYYDASTGHNRGFVGFYLPNLNGMRIDFANFNIHQYHQYYVNSLTQTYVAEISRRPTLNDTWGWMPPVTKWAISSAWTTLRNQEVNFDLKSYMQSKVAANQEVVGLAVYQSEMGDQNTTHWRRYYSAWSNISHPLLTLKYYPQINSVTNLKAPTTASDGWFKEVTGKENLNDRNDQGRGNVTLTWNPSVNAKGYLIYGWDGTNYNIVGKTVGNAATTWSSEGGGVFPTDTDIKNLKTAFEGNSFISASTPSDESYLAKTTLTYPSGMQTNPAGNEGAGLVAFDGYDMYVKKWSSYPGPNQWVQFKKTGMSGQRPTYGTGKKIATDIAGTPSFSAFTLNGVLYEGYVTRVGGGTADIKGFGLSTIMTDAQQTTLTLSKPPLHYKTGAEVTGATNAVQLTTDGTFIYSGSGITGSPNLKVRIYDEHGTFIADKTIARPGQSEYINFNGFTSDGNNLYFYDWTTVSSVTKVSTKSWLITNQWYTVDTLARRAVSIIYDSAHNLFVMGQVQEGRGLYVHSGIGVDLRDDPRPLYRKTKSNVYNEYTNYWFRVAPYTDYESQDPFLAAVAQPTLTNRTARVSDSAQRSFVPLALIAGEVLEGSVADAHTRLRTADLAIKSPGPTAALTRSFASDMAHTSTYLPKGWIFGFEANVKVNGTGLIYTSSDGTVYNFVAGPTNTFIAPNGMNAKMTQNTTQYILEYHDKTKRVFDRPTGRLLSETDRQGRTVTYTITPSEVTIKAANNQVITLNKLSNTQLSATLNALGSTSGNTRVFNYTISGSNLTATGYPGSDAQIARTYTIASQKITKITSGTDIVNVTHGTTSITAQRDVSTLAPPQKHTLTYASTAHAQTKKTTYERGTLSATGGYKGGYEKSEYYINPAKQTIWSSISPAADADGAAGIYIDYDAENNVRMTQAPTVLKLTSSKVEVKGKGKGDKFIQESFTYDGRGNLINTTDANGGYSQHFYNAKDELIKTIDPARSVTWYAYDSLGRLTRIEKLVEGTGRKGRSEFTYDSAHNLTQARRAISQSGTTYTWETTQYANYTAHGDPQKITYKDVRLEMGGVLTDIIEQRSYDGFGNMTAHTDPIGAVTSATYDIAGRQVSTTSASGIVSHTAYDASWNVSETYLIASGITGKYDWAKSTFNACGNVVATQHLAPDGEEISRADIEYDVLAREVANTTSDVEGAAQIKYDEAGNMIAASPAVFDDGEFNLTVYDNLNRPIQYNNTQRSFQGITHEFDDHSRVAFCSHGGIIYKTTRDEAGNIIEKVEYKDHKNGPVANTVTSIPDLRANPLKVTETTGGSTTPATTLVNTYDLLGRLTSTKMNDQPVSATVYNSLGWVLQQNDYDGAVTTTKYNARGDVIYNNQGGLITSATYDSAGRIATRTEDGVTVTYTYDNLDRVIRELHSSASATLKDLEVVYDSKGRTSSITENISEHTRQFTYTQVGEGEDAYLETVITDTFAGGRQSVQTIHGDDFTAGSLTLSGETTQTTSLATSLERDEVNRVVGRAVGSATHTYGYDTNTGHLIFDSALSASGTTTYAYVGEGANLTSANYSKLGQSAQYVYSTDRQTLSSAKIGSATADIYTFASNRNLVQSLGGPSAASCTYDSKGQITTSTQVVATQPKKSPLPSGSLEENSTTLTYTPAASWTRTAFSAASGGYVMRASVNNALMTFTLVGSELSIVGITAPTAGKIEVTINGKVVQVVDCYSPTTLYQQVLTTIPLTEGVHKVSLKMLIASPANRVDIDKISGKGLCLRFINTTAPAATTLAVEDDNAALTYNGGWKTAAHTNLSGGTSHRATVNGAEMSFSFKGSRVVITGTKANGYGKMKVYLDDNPTPVALIDSYSATSAYKQTLATINTTDAAHTLRIVADLDTTGKTACIDRFDVTGVSPAVRVWYDTVASTETVTNTYTHNTLGQRTSIEGGTNATYSWTGQRLSGVTNHLGSTQYVYDGYGQRTEKTQVRGEESTKTSYIYDGLTLLSLESVIASETQTLTYLYADSSTPVGALYQSTESTQTVAFEIISDRRGDVREMRDSDGNPFARFDYDAYGKIRAEEVFATILIDEETAQAITDLQPLRYAGYVWDSEISLYYCSQRYYDPTIGAFISKDPIKADGEMSFYAYCLGEPINNVDPSGLDYITRLMAAQRAAQQKAYWQAYQNYYANLYPNQLSNSFSGGGGGGGNKGNPTCLDTCCRNSNNVLAVRLNWTCAVCQFLIDPSGKVIGGRAVGGTINNGKPTNDPFAYYDAGLQGRKDVNNALITFGTGATIASAGVAWGLLGPVGAQAAGLGAQPAVNETVKVIGKLPDTAKYAGQKGYEVIASSGWTFEKNVIWINDAIAKGQTFHLASPLNVQTLQSFDPNHPGLSVFGHEVLMLLNAGYRIIGNTMVAP